jgi:AcrR family transcriptional regulator
MEAIAVAAHVSKATIYRRWPSKDALILELITRAADEPPNVEEPGSGDTRADLQEWVRRALDEERTPLGAALQQLVRRAAEDPALAANLRRRELRRHRDRFAAILERGVSAGQVRADLDLPTLLDMLSGPALYRRLLDPGPPAMHEPGDQARAIIDIVWPGIRASHQG